MSSSATIGSAVFSSFTGIVGDNGGSGTSIETAVIAGRSISTGARRVGLTATGTSSRSVGSCRSTEWNAAASSLVAVRMRNVSGPMLNRSPARSAISVTGPSLTHVRESIDLTIVRFSPTRISAWRPTTPSTFTRIAHSSLVPIRCLPGASAIDDSPQ